MKNHGKINIQKPSYQRLNCIRYIQSAIRNLSHAYIHEINENKRWKAKDTHHLFLKNVKTP